MSTFVWAGDSANSSVLAGSLSCINCFTHVLSASSFASTLGLACLLFVCICLHVPRHGRQEHGLMRQTKQTRLPDEAGQCCFFNFCWFCFLFSLALVLFAFCSYVNVAGLHFHLALCFCRQTDIDWYCTWIRNMMQQAVNKLRNQVNLCHTITQNMCAPVNRQAKYGTCGRGRYRRARTIKTDVTRACET